MVQPVLSQKRPKAQGISENLVMIAPRPRPILAMKHAIWHKEQSVLLGGEPQPAIRRKGKTMSRMAKLSVKQ